MEPITLTTAAVLAALAPYVAKGAESVAQEFGKKAVEKAEALIKGLWGRWRGKPEAQQALASYVEDPNAAHQQKLDEALSGQLAEDPELRAEVHKLLEGGSPDIFIRQVVTDADKVIGMKVGEMIRGRLRFEQDVSNAKEVIGPEFGKIG